MNMKSFFPSVTNKWIFQDHLPSKTLSTPTARFYLGSEFYDTLSLYELEALSPRKSEKNVQRIPQYH